MVSLGASAGTKAVREREYDSLVATCEGVVSVPTRGPLVPQVHTSGSEISEGDLGKRTGLGLVPRSALYPGIFWRRELPHYYSFATYQEPCHGYENTLSLFILSLLVSVTSTGNSPRMDCS